MRRFDRAAAAAADVAGHPATFAGTSVGLVVWWYFGLPLSIGDISILLVLLVQNSQNRDTAAIQVKLDELICGTPDADDALIAIDKNADDVKQIREDHEDRHVEEKSR